MGGTADCELARLMSASSRKSPYFGKDLAKARRATQFIGQGSSASSTAAYARAAAHLANTGSYTSADVVFVSSEGARGGRFDPVGKVPNGAYRNLDLAIAAGARFVVDRKEDRDRGYNVGERQVVAYLRSKGYAEVEPGLFAPSAP